MPPRHGPARLPEGRRGCGRPCRRLLSDNGAEAALLSKAMGAPVQLFRTREDELQHDYYRPGGMHRLRAGLDSRGRLVAWEQHLANPSRYAFAGRRDPVTSELYKDDLPAGILPHVRMAYTLTPSAVPGGAWRATLHSANAFAVQSFLDELAHAAGRDPLEFLLELLGAPRQLAYEGHGGPVLDTGRLAGVLRLAAEKAGWSTPLPAGRARGIAAHFTFGSYVAEVAEVSRGCRAACSTGSVPRCTGRSPWSRAGWRRRTSTSTGCSGWTRRRGWRSTFWPARSSPPAWASRRSRRWRRRLPMPSSG